MKFLVIKNAGHENPGIFGMIMDKYRIKYDLLEQTDETELPNPDNYTALLIMGGAFSANDKTPKIQNQIEYVKKLIAIDKPVLAVCLGFQILAKAAGCEVLRAPVKEVGWFSKDEKQYEIRLTPDGAKDPIFKGMHETTNVFHLHGETISLNDNVKLLATGNLVENQVIRVGKNMYGVQFHFELTSEMLVEWHRIDPWLNKTNLGDLKEIYRISFADYYTNANKLFENFIEIVQQAK